MKAIPDIKEKSKGAVIAFAIGDALGWPNERRSATVAYSKNYISTFKQWVKKSGGRYWPHSETILPGEYSDDTQLMLAVSRSLLSGSDWSNYLTKHELPFWPQYERGGGRAVLKAANQWGKGKRPWEDKDEKAYYTAGGNGAAMRILPHVIKNLPSNNFEDIYNDVIKDSILTHGHPRAILGALCYAYSAYYLLLKTDTLNYCELISAVISNANTWGAFPENLAEDWLLRSNKYYNYESEWIKTLAMIIYNLKFMESALSEGALEIERDTLMDCGCYDNKINGAGDIAAITSIYFASKYANNPALGIKQAANLFGADTDTIAAMTGGLMGSLCGVEWIPYEWRLVQDYNCLELIAECLISSNGSEELKAFIAQNQSNDYVRLEIGKAKCVDEFIIPSNKSMQIKADKYITVLGQTIYIKSYSRIKNADANHSTIRIKTDKLAELIDKDNCSNITLKDVMLIRKLVLEGNDIDLIANKLSLSPNVISKLLKVIIY